MVQDLNKLGPIEEQHANQEKRRKLIVELGKFFEKSVDDFIAAHGDIEGEVVIGAATYLKDLYQERMVGYMLHHSVMWQHLKGAIDKDGVKIHTPFENDGIESHKFSSPSSQGGGR